MHRERLPKAWLKLVRSQETMPAVEEEASYPYSEYYWKAVACVLLSGRVRARQEDGQPNRSELDRFCKEANFNQHYFAGIARCLVANGAVEARFGAYQRGAHFDGFMGGHLQVLRDMTADGLQTLLHRCTPLRRWRPTQQFVGVETFLRLSFAPFRGKALPCETVGPLWLALAQEHGFKVVLF